MWTPQKRGHTNVKWNVLGRHWGVEHILLKMAANVWRGGEALSKLLLTKKNSFAMASNHSPLDWKLVTGFAYSGDVLFYLAAFFSSSKLLRNNHHIPILSPANFLPPTSPPPPLSTNLSNATKQTFGLWLPRLSILPDCIFVHSIFWQQNCTKSSHPKHLLVGQNLFFF